MQNPTQRPKIPLPYGITPAYLRRATLRVQRWARNQAPKGRTPPRHIHEMSELVRSVIARNNPVT